MSLLDVQDLSVRRGQADVLESIDFSIGTGEFVGLIGPNGAGKTTLMRAVLGLLPHQGKSSLAALPEARRARSAAWMPQAREIAWPVTVETVVMLGRMPHQGAFAVASDRDLSATEQALDQMGLTAMRNRPATELSGGEQARVLIARALAQETPLLIADEPTAGLDPGHQIATMACFADLARAGKSCLVSLHDLGLAARYCTRLILLGDRRIVADGVPSEVLTPERLAQVFGITAWYQETDQGPVFQPLTVLE